MNCFGDIEKISTNCDANSFESHHNRFVWNRKKPETILITESPNLVTRYQINHKHLIPNQSWSFKELNRLCIPLLCKYNDNNNNRNIRNPNYFIGIHSCNTLIEWSLNDSNELKQEFKKIFKNPIIDLILPDDFNEPLLIFSNGYAKYLEKAKNDELEWEFQPIIEKNEKILGIKSQMQKQHLVMYYVVYNKINKNIIIYKCFFNKSMITKTIKSVATRKPDTWTFYYLNQILIGAKKENDQILVYSLESESKNSNNIFKFDSPSFETLCSMAICKSGAFCFLGKKSNGDYIMDVYETKYSIKIGSMNLDKTIIENNFYAIKDNILIMCKNQILMVPIVNQKFLLSQLLTKSLNTDTSSNNITTTIINSTQNECDNIKKENYQQFFRQIGLNFDVDSKESLTVDYFKEINKKFDRIINFGSEIPEEIIVELLDYSTKNYLKFKDNGNNQETEIHNELKELFNKIIRISYNEVFLVSCLKSSNITTEQYLLAIQLLLEHIPSNNTFFLTWISVLIDVNYNKFIIRPNKEVIETLQKIQDRICYSIDFFEELGTVKTLIEILTKNERRLLDTLTNRSYDKGQYCIELLTFS